LRKSSLPEITGATPRSLSLLMTIDGKGGAAAASNRTVTMNSNKAGGGGAIPSTYVKEYQMK